MIDPDKVNAAIEQLDKFSPAELNRLKEEFGISVYDLVYEIFTTTINNPNWSHEKKTALDLTVEYLIKNYPFLSNPSRIKVIDEGLTFWYADEE